MTKHHGFEFRTIWYGWVGEDAEVGTTRMGTEFVQQRSHRLLRLPNCQSPAVQIDNDLPKGQQVPQAQVKIITTFASCFLYCHPQFDPELNFFTIGHSSRLEHD